MFTITGYNMSCIANQRTFYHLIVGWVQRKTLQPPGDGDHL